VEERRIRPDEAPSVPSAACGVLARGAAGGGAVSLGLAGIAVEGVFELLRALLLLPARLLRSM
jgi:hypothetical protein